MGSKKNKREQRVCKEKENKNDKKNKKRDKYLDQERCFHGLDE